MKNNIKTGVIAFISISLFLGLMLTMIHVIVNQPKEEVKEKIVQKETNILKENVKDIKEKESIYSCPLGFEYVNDNCQPKQEKEQISAINDSTNNIKGAVSEMMNLAGGIIKIIAVLMLISSFFAFMQTNRPETLLVGVITATVIGFAPHIFSSLF